VSVDFDSSKMENWYIHPRGMMKYYQSQKYLLGQSIADLIDNCFDSGATKIDVQMDYSEQENLFIRVLDNGKGMDETTLSSAMQLGSERQRNDSELGIFGIGMKLSSLAQASQVTVVSKISNQYSTRRIDANYIREFNENKIFKYGTNLDSFSESQDLMIEGNWSTMILLEEITRKGWRTYNLNEDEALTKQIEKIRIHLRLTYHRILEKDPDISFKFQGKPLLPLDPSMPWETDSKYGTVMNSDRIIVTLNNEKVIVPIKYVIIPHSLQFKKDKRKCKSIHKGYNKANDMQGLYLYRNHRLIEYGGWHNLLGDVNEEHDKCGLILIEIPPKYSEEFGLNPTKTEVQLPDEFMEKLNSKVGEKTRWGTIKSGKEITYREAIDYRYRNEGKKAINRDKKKALQKKQGLTGTGGAETTQSKVPAAPGSKSKKGTTAPKPKPVVTNINESDPNWTIVQLDKQKDGYQKLIEMLRMWEE
jgi:hypothetical protein